jgi:hypothetical protein
VQIFGARYSARTSNKGNEDSFFCNIVKPLLHAAFEGYEGVNIRGKGDRLICNPALDKEVLFPDYFVTIDCYDKMKGEHYLVSLQAHQRWSLMQTVSSFPT